GGARRTAAGDLGRGAGAEHADEVLVAPPAEVAGGRKAVEVLEERRAGPRPMPGDYAGQGLELRVADRFEDERGDDLALAPHDAVDGPARVIEDFGGDERDAVAAGEDEAVGPPRLGPL